MSIHLKQTKNLIIGLHGRAGAGKDTAADFLPDYFCKLAFAKPLKDSAKVLFNFTDKQLYDPIEKEKVDQTWNKSPRQILQWLGTDILRNNIGTDFFLKHMKQRIEQSSYNCFVVVDIRFPNEAKFIKDMGGIIIEVARNKTGTIHSNHETEQRISEHLIDETITNDSTKDALKTAFFNVINIHL